jgi:hypothetical protein
MVAVGRWWGQVGFLCFEHLTKHFHTAPQVLHFEGLFVFGFA